MFRCDLVVLRMPEARRWTWLPIGLTEAVVVTGALVVGIVAGVSIARPVVV
jgi:hypothetical protein